eukprot:134909_1
MLSRMIKVLPLMLLLCTGAFVNAAEPKVSENTSDFDDPSDLDSADLAPAPWRIPDEVGELLSFGYMRRHAAEHSISIPREIKDFVNENYGDRIQLILSQLDKEFTITGGSFFPVGTMNLDLFHNVEPGTKDLASYSSFIDWFEDMNDSDQKNVLTFTNFKGDSKTPFTHRVPGISWKYNDWKAGDIVTIIASDYNENFLAYVPVKLEIDGIVPEDRNVRRLQENPINAELDITKSGKFFLKIPNVLKNQRINQFQFTRGNIDPKFLTDPRQASGFIHKSLNTNGTIGLVDRYYDKNADLLKIYIYKPGWKYYNLRTLKNWLLSWDIDVPEPITAFFLKDNMVVSYVDINMRFAEKALEKLNEMNLSKDEYSLAKSPSSKPQSIGALGLETASEEKQQPVEPKQPAVKPLNSQKQADQSATSTVPKRKQSTTSKQSSKEKSATDPLNASLTSADPAKNVVQRSRVDPLKVKQPVQAKPGSGEKQSKPPSASSKVKLGADKPKTKPYSPPELYPLKTKHDALKKQDLNEEKVDLKPAALKNKKQLAGSKLSKPLNQSNRQKLLNRQKQDGQSTTSAVSEDTKDPYAGPEDNTVSEEDIPDDVSNLGVDAGDVAQKNGSSSVGGFIFIIMLALMVGLFVWQKEYILKMFENL